MSVHKCFLELILSESFNSPRDQSPLKWLPGGYSSSALHFSEWPHAGWCRSFGFLPCQLLSDWHLVRKTHGSNDDYKCGSRSSLMKSWSRSPSRLAFSPEGSSKLHPLREAPSALEQSIFTPCKFAPCRRETKRQQESGFSFYMQILSQQSIIWSYWTKMTRVHFCI